MQLAVNPGIYLPLKVWSGHCTYPRMSTGTGQNYSVQLLLPRWVHLDAFALVTMLRRWRPDVELATCDHEHVTVAIGPAICRCSCSCFTRCPSRTRCR